MDDTEKTVQEFLDYIKTFLDNIQRQYTDYTDAVLKIKKHDVGHDGGYEIIIDAFTKETDVEYVKRVAKEKRENDKKLKEAEKKENADRQLYEELKKRFG
jgi:signal recognition particle receptor subunit beta